MAALSRCGVVIILFIQIYNWFPLKTLPWVMALLWSIEHTGYVIWINIDIKYDGIKYFVVAFFYFCFAVFDGFYFMYHPSQVNIFVEDYKRSCELKALFDIQSLSVKLH